MGSSLCVRGERGLAPTPLPLGSGPAPGEPPGMALINQLSAPHGTFQKLHRDLALTDRFPLRKKKSHVSIGFFFEKKKKGNLMKKKKI